MRYYIIAGERSGDLHGANLVRELHRKDPSAEIRCWGGDAMEQAGAELVVHYRDLAFMGFLEVARNLLTIRRLMQKCKKDLLSFTPDVLILIDYPGFNMRMAKFASQNHIPVHYYISPKIWAWNQGRARQIRAHVDRMYVILPFEEAFYRRFDFEVTYVGNPLLDAIRSFQADPDFTEKNRLHKPLIAVLPGSRRQEVSNMLNTMLALAPSFPDYQFVVAAVSNLPAELYEPARQTENVRVVEGKTYDILHHARAALVTSGTATLETALFEVPQLVCYKTSALSYLIARRLIKVPYISLVNLIADEEVVPELIQQDFEPGRLKQELSSILLPGAARAKQQEAYRKLRLLMGDEKVSEKVAALICESLGEQSPQV
jgi:lipid-A-disaccharide synthase